jgi:hypothetical protein
MPINPLVNLINESIDWFTTNLQVSSVVSSSTHKTLEVSGFDTVEAVPYLARYLVGLRLAIVDYAGKICADLLGESQSDTNDTINAVNAIIKPPPRCVGDALTQWKATYRNAWIAEGVWHCCLRVAMARHEIHPPGTVVALDYAHVSPKDHGFDVVAIYSDQAGQLGISFVETKAYQNDPNQAISDAVKMHKEIENGKHEGRIRKAMGQLRNAVSPDIKAKIIPAMWRDNRTHIPNPHYERSGATVQWGRQRHAFSNLNKPVILMPHAINGYSSFFDSVADAMRSVAEGI